MILSAPEECAGRVTKCRGCQGPIVVPQPASQPAAQQPGRLQPPPRDKTALGRVISHRPTGVQPPAPSGPASAAQNYPPGKPAKTPQDVASPRQAPPPSAQRSLLPKVALIAVGVLFVFCGGGVFGFGAYYFFGAHKDAGPGPGGNSHAQSAVKPEADLPPAPRGPSVPSERSKEEKPEAPAPAPIPPARPTAAPPALTPERPKEVAPPQKEQSAPPLTPPKGPPPAPALPPKPEVVPKPDTAPDPASPPKPDPMPKPGPAPKPDLPPKPEPPPRKEGPKLDERLAPWVEALKSKRSQERLQAVEELGKLKEAARPAAHALCETLVSDSAPPVRRAALDALEKVYPELHAPVVVLAVEANPEKHAAAARDVAALGEQGQAAVPVLLFHLRTAPTRFPSQAAALMAEDAQVLGQIAPDDVVVQKTLLELTRLTLTLPRQRGDIGGPVRAAAIRAVGDLLDKRPEAAKHVVPGLVTATRGMTDSEVRGQAIALLGRAAENHADLRRQIAAAFVTLVNAGDTRVVAQFGKCGRDAQDALPLLKKLKLHPVETVRIAANEAIGQIEGALAGAALPPHRERPPATPEPKPSAADAGLPSELRPLVAQLKTGTTEERLKAAAALAELGEKAQPAAGALCEAALSPSQKVSRAALDTLAKVHPELQKPVFVLVVDEKAANHLDALRTLSTLSEQGKPATSVVLHEIKRCQELLNDPRARWTAPTLLQVTGESMKTLPKIAADDPQALRTIIDLTKFSLTGTTTIRRKNRFVSTRVPFRHEGLAILGELAEGQPAFRKQIIPPVTAVLKEAVQQTSAPSEFQVLTAIAEVEDAGNALLKCGDEARQTLTKEVVPRLKDLQFHKSDQVRKTAEALRQKIEDTP
jgi:HEAT repeat protein